jgi:signal peptidase I
VSDLDPAGALQGNWPDRPAGEPPKLHRRSFFRELPFLIVVALVLALLVKTFLVQAFYIPSESMEPTLHGCPQCRGDRVLVNRLVYRFRQPRRGEVIVFTGRPIGSDKRSLLGKAKDFLTDGLGVSRPDDPDFIKRIIGLPNETVEVTGDGVVHITRADRKKIALDEPYVRVKETRPFGPAKVPDGEYFMMGDNRTHSADSRYGLGTIPRHDIVGKAFVKIWPPGRMGRIDLGVYNDDTPAAAGLVIGWWGLGRRRRLDTTGGSDRKIAA